MFRYRREGKSEEFRESRGINGASMADASREEGGREGKGSPSTLFGFSFSFSSYWAYGLSNVYL